MEEDLLKKLNGTSLYDKIIETKKLYEKLNRKEEKFCNTFHIYCKKDCGECCRNFEPDVTELEALYLAYGIIKEGKTEEILNKEIVQDEGNKCPFFDENKFCTVYAYRPLICRLFNACASTDKYGNPDFRPCKWNEKENKITASDFKAHAEDVITMEEFGEELTEEETENEKTYLLLDAVKKAIGKIMLILEIKGEE